MIHVKFVTVSASGFCILFKDVGLTCMTKVKLYYVGTHIISVEWKEAEQQQEAGSGLSFMSLSPGNGSGDATSVSPDSETTSRGGKKSLWKVPVLRHSQELSELTPGGLESPAGDARPCPGQPSVPHSKALPMASAGSSAHRASPLNQFPLPESKWLMSTCNFSKMAQCVFSEISCCILFEVPCTIHPHPATPKKKFSILSVCP